MDNVPQDAVLFFYQHPESFPLYEAFYGKLMSRFPETEIKVAEISDFLLYPASIRLCFLSAIRKEGRSAGTLFCSYAGTIGTVDF